MQTTYTLDATTKFDGLNADVRVPTELVDAIAGEDLDFGDMVYVDKWSEREIRIKKLTAAKKAEFFGIVIHQPKVGGEYKTGNVVPVMRKGVVWVDNTAASTAAGGFAKIDGTGLTFQSSTATSGDITHYGVQILTAATAAGDLIKVQLNLPNYFVTA